jgi:succinoglycan biosynthesis transport protein ExoP
MAKDLNNQLDDLFTGQEEPIRGIELSEPSTIPEKKRQQDQPREEEQLTMSLGTKNGGGRMVEKAAGTQRPESSGMTVLLQPLDGPSQKVEEVELGQILQVARKWWWLIVACTLVAAAIGFGYSTMRPPVYRASTSLLVRLEGSINDDYVAMRASAQLAATYAELLTKRPVIEAAAWALGLDPDQTEEKVQVRLVPETLVIEVTVEDKNPRLAAEIANGIVAAFMQISRKSGGVRARDLIVVEPATLPLKPTPVRHTLYTALAAVVGAMLAVGLVFLLEYPDDTIKTPDDVSRALGLATLGAIGRLAKGEESLVMAAQPLSPVAEAFRLLCTNIRFSSVDRPLRTLLVTSPGLTEGKSITVANLAAAMAQAGLRVLAVDADLRRPRLHQLFDLDLDQEGNGGKLWWGLSGSLLEGCTDGRLHPVQVEGLRVLPSGELPPNPAEIMGSQHMQQLLHQLAQEVDVVLIDSPPVLPVADATALAQAVDGVLLVLEAGHTRRGAARQAVESLRQVGANLVGVVLNAVPTHKGSYYYYFYHETYGNGSGRRKRRRQRLFGRRRKAD